jgi:hypothetical protein
MSSSKACCRYADGRRKRKSGSRLFLLCRPQWWTHTSAIARELRYSRHAESVFAPLSMVPAAVVMRA